MYKIFLCMILVVCSSSCYTTSTSVHSVDDRARVVVLNAPSDSEMYVNGKNMGPASNFEKGENAMLFESGTYTIEVKEGSRSLYRQELFLGPSMEYTVAIDEGARR